MSETEQENPPRFVGATVKRTGQKPRRVIAVSGAKGGTGKTVIASNLAIYLASLGRSTVVVDADRSGAHLHTLLGLAPRLPAPVSRAREPGPLEIVATAVPGLYFVEGGLVGGEPGMSRPRTRAELFTAMNELDCDYMVLDLGAGVAQELLVAFLAADLGLYVTVPEPAAIEGTYRFVRTLFLHALLGASDAADRAVVERLAEELGGLAHPRELVQALEADHVELGARARALLASFEVRFVVNQTRLRDDLELGESMRSAAWQRFGLSLEYLGYIDYDDTVWTCARACAPLLVKSPSTKASKSIEKLARRMIGIDAGKSGVRGLRTVPPGTHHDLLEIDRGATDEEIRRAHRRVREVYAPESLACYGLFTALELEQIRARLDEAFDVLLDRARRRPYELSVFPDEPERSEEALDETAQNRDLPPAPTVTPETQFDGALLRAIRESKGLELKQISRRTKIGVGYLEAIEEDNFAALPAVVYVRGFVSELAKSLDVDPVQASQTYVRRVRRNLGESGT